MSSRTAFQTMLLLAAWPSFACGQGSLADVEVKATHVTGPIHVLRGAGGNLGASVGEDGILLVDDQFAPLADKIRAALAELGEGKVAYVLNTHYHGDHTGGNAEFGGEATIVAHTNVRWRLAEPVTTPGSERVALPKTALPVITFDDSLSVHFNGEEIRAIHLPHGHTDGDLVVFFTRSRVVHLGDLFFNTSFPYVDLDGGGTVRGYIANVEYLLERLPEDVKLICGHGPPVASRSDLMAYHEMLVETVGAVRRGMQAGKSLEQLQTERVLEPWQSWSGEFISSDRWIATIHREPSGP